MCDCETVFCCTNTVLRLTREPSDNLPRSVTNSSCHWSLQEASTLGALKYSNHDRNAANAFPEWSQKQKENGELKWLAALFLPWKIQSRCRRRRFPSGLPQMLPWKKVFLVYATGRNSMVQQTSQASSDLFKKDSTLSRR